MIWGEASGTRVAFACVAVGRVGRKHPNELVVRQHRKQRVNALANRQRRVTKRKLCAGFVEAGVERWVRLSCRTLWLDQVEVGAPAGLAGVLRARHRLRERGRDQFIF